ncbi:hypothetical protein Tco_0129072 [Tanacetum coccineum]
MAKGPTSPCGGSHESGGDSSPRGGNDKEQDSAALHCYYCLVSITTVSHFPYFGISVARPWRYYHVFFNTGWLVLRTVLMVDSITFGQEMVNILVSEEAYDKVFNHLDMLHAPLEGKVLILRMLSHYYLMLFKLYA